MTIMIKHVVLVLNRPQGDIDGLEKAAFCGWATVLAMPQLVSAKARWPRLTPSSTPDCVTLV